MRKVLVCAALAVACSRTPPRANVEAGGPALDRAEIARDGPEARARRDELVAAIEDAGYLSAPSVRAAMREVPRHLFVEASLADAYADTPLPIGEGQTISQPSVVSAMTEALDVKPDHRVLEIGTGSGYQAAVLSRLAAEVYTIEVVPALGERAAARLRELGYRNVHVKIGDGYQGWPEHAPFPRIILTAAPPEIPQALIDQLADGGILVAPVGEPGDQWLVRIRKQGEKLTRERIERVRFVPMVRPPR